MSELLEELQGAVVALRGNMTLQDASSQVKNSSKKSTTSSDVIQAALYLKQVRGSDMAFPMLTLWCVVASHRC